MSISAASGQFKGNLTEDMIRHIFLNNIAGYRKKYSAEFGDELIMACDGKGYWRKDFFPYYKMKRAKNRAESPLDWDFVFQCINKIYDEIQEYFPDGHPDKIKPIDDLEPLLKLLKEIQ